MLKVRIIILTFSAIMIFNIDAPLISIAGGVTLPLQRDPQVDPNQDRPEQEICQNWTKNQCLSTKIPVHTDSISFSQELIYQVDFSNMNFLEDWHLDGFADLTIHSEGEERCLIIQTRSSENNPDDKQSVLWCKRKWTGNLHYAIRVKGETGNRSIIYFNASSTRKSGLKSIFEWKRPNAQMVHYAGDERLEMYSVSVLRDTGTGETNICNLRYIGGSTWEAFHKLNRGVNKSYDQETVFAYFPSPFDKKPDKWFVIEILVTGRRIQLIVDGERLLDVEDPGNAGSESYAWDALIQGGYFGIRNFQPKAMYLDFFKVYQIDK